jgi:sugar (pentulose or hexulose) kinase
LVEFFTLKYAQIDLSDGSGMNLLNLQNLDWDEECINSVSGGKN